MNAVETTEAQKKALLQAVAEAGSAGRAAYQRSQAEMQSGQQAAVSAALTRASNINATPGYTAEAQETAAAPYQRAQTDLSLGQTAFEQDIARQSLSGQNHLSSIQAAIPIHEAQSRTAMQRILSQSRENSAERQANLDEQLRMRMESQRERTFAQDERQAAQEQERERIAREEELYRRAIEDANIERWNDAVDRNNRIADENRIRQWELEDRAWEEAHRKSGGGGGRSGGSSSPASFGIEGLADTFGSHTAARSEVKAWIDQLARNNYEGSRRAQQPISEAAAINAALERAAGELGMEPGALRAWLGGGQYEPDAVPDREPQERSQGSIRTSDAYRSTISDAQGEVNRLYNERDDEGSRIRTRGDAVAEVAAQIRALPDYRQYQQIYEQVISDL